MSAHTARIADGPFHIFHHSWFTACWLFWRCTWWTAGAHSIRPPIIPRAVAPLVSNVIDTCLCEVCLWQNFGRRSEHPRTPWWIHGTPVPSSIFYLGGSAVQLYGNRSITSRSPKPPVNIWCHVTGVVCGSWQRLVSYHARWNVKLGLTRLALGAEHRYELTGGYVKMPWFVIICWTLPMCCNRIAAIRLSCHGSILLSSAFRYTARCVTIA